MATYLAILASAGKLTLDHLAYVHLVVSEAVKYRGDGWRTYDTIFRQNMAAGALGLTWSRIDAGLHAISFQSMRASLVSCCPTCLEPDHGAQECALGPPSSLPVRHHSLPGRSKPVNRSSSAGAPYTQVCYSWNNGSCVRHPNPCRFEHICLKCARVGARRAHRSVECRSHPNDQQSTHGPPGSTGQSASGSGVAPPARR